MARGKQSKTAARAVVAAERKEEVIRFRKAGMTYAEIADRVGIQKSRISKILHEYLDHTEELTETDAQVLRAEELARLEQLWRAIYPTALRGSLPAIDRCVRLSESKRRLMGIEAPTKIAPTDPTGTREYEGAGLASLLAARRANDDSAGK